MGEFGIYKQNRIKVGTCNFMYYCRYENRYQIDTLENNVDFHSEKNLYWRLPLVSEDALKPGEYGSGFPGVRLCKTFPDRCPENFKPLECADYPGKMQLKHDESGLLVNVNCYHGIKLPLESDDFQPHWNGKGYAFELVALKNTRNQNDENSDFIQMVCQCRFCGNMFTCEFSEISDYIFDKELKKRLSEYRIK